MRLFSGIIKRNWEIAKSCIRLNRKLFAIQIINIFIENITLIINLLMPKFLLNAMSSNDNIHILTILIIVFLINIVSGLIEMNITPYIKYQTEKINVEVVNNFLEKSYSLNISFFDDPKSYDKYSIAFDNCCDIVHNSKNIILTLLSSLLQILMIITVLNWINIWIFILMITVIIFNLFISQKTKELQYEYQKNIATQNRQLNFIYRLFYIPQFIRDIRINSLKDFIFNKKNSYTDTLLKFLSSNSKKLSKNLFVQTIIISCENFMVMGYFVIEFLRKKIWLDDFFIAINAYNTLKNSINNVLSVYNSLYENDLYIRDYLDFINNSNCESNLGNINILPHEIQSIKFDGVYFKYPNKTDYALKNINLEIKKNDKIAIVGSNGSGKTTIIKLIIRLYEVEKGTILLNNIDIKQYNIMSLRRCVAILFQDYTMYPFTIKENITFGKHIINKDLYQVLDRVDMLDKVQNLPLTIETPITSQLSDHGIELSGGESQRIAISRILIQKNEVLVLDEPTSNLDPIIEKQLYETLLNEMHSNILIIISHRFSFTYKLQKIICISNGSIVEYGSHDELMKLNGYYKKLYDLSCSNSIS